MKNIAIFCSGKGTNLQAIINAVGKRKLNANISLVISDRQNSFSLTRAKRAGIEALFIDPERFGTRAGFEKEIMRNL
ncbi:MAG: phosphoribosylglycinamide formyltransferase, partial [Candidatus Omnitrophica bacterium]|nr:phosphoribosylglycinamide formyltransferase [Candidatus Omnitrophota bacterium]